MLEHIEHLKGFSPAWVCMCRVRFDCCENDFQHTEHTNSMWPCIVEQQSQIFYSSAMFWPLSTGRNPSALIGPCCQDICWMCLSSHGEHWVLTIINQVKETLWDPALQGSAYRAVHILWYSFFKSSINAFHNFYHISYIFPYWESNPVLRRDEFLHVGCVFLPKENTGCSPQCI